MDAVWASAAFQPEHTVLRLRLRPYSCGHEILLGIAESPIVLGGGPDWNDLFLAVAICSQTFSGGLDLLQRPKRIRAMAWAWRLFLWRMDLIHESNCFRDYLMQGRWGPDTMTAIGGGGEMRTLKAPHAFRLVWFLCSEMNMTEADALDFPMARAQAYYAACLDKKGEIDLEGDNDRELVRRAREMGAAEKNGEAPWR